MAPQPDTNTARLFVDYVVNGADVHHLKFRFVEGTSQASAVAQVNDVLTELDDVFYTDTIFEAARWAEAHQTVSFPVDWTPVNGAASPTGRPLDFRARFLSFVGRSEFGVNWHLSFFGVTLIPDANFRVLDSEAPTVAAVRDALLAGPPAIVAADALPIISLNYFTNRVSAYWQRKIARGG